MGVSERIALAKRSKMVTSSPVEALDEDVDGTAAGEADGDRFGVADPIGGDARPSRADGILRLFVNGRLDATAAHRARDVAALVHRQGRAWRPWRRDLDADHRRERNALALGAPSFDCVQNVG